MEPLPESPASYRFPGKPATASGRDAGRPPGVVAVHEREIGESIALVVAHGDALARAEELRRLDDFEVGVARGETRREILRAEEDVERAALERDVRVVGVRVVVRRADEQVGEPV